MYLSFKTSSEHALNINDGQSLASFSVLYPSALEGTGGYSWH